jgi:hypothetical protein
MRAGGRVSIAAVLGAGNELRDERWYATQTRAIADSLEKWMLK